MKYHTSHIDDINKAEMLWSKRRLFAPKRDSRRGGEVFAVFILLFLVISILVNLQGF